MCSTSVRDRRSAKFVVNPIGNLQRCLHTALLWQSWVVGDLPALIPSSNIIASHHAFNVTSLIPVTQALLRYGVGVGNQDNAVRRRYGGRSARVRTAVLDAAMEVLTDFGWGRFSVAEVANRAGVHETSIYRRWGTRERLVTEALLMAGDQQLPIPDTGSLRGDLVAFARDLAQYLTTPLGAALAQALVAPVEDDLAMADARTQYFQARFQLASVIVNRAVLRGELPDGAMTDGAMALEMLCAPLHFRYLVSHQPIDNELVHRLADLMIQALGGSAPRRPRAEA
jgi:AcrR family transcriptional regulator